MSKFVRETVAKAAPIIAVVACLALTVPLFLDYAWDAKFANDFGVYWRTANMPAEQAYHWKGRFPFPYMPTMLLWIQPLSLVPKWPAYALFVAISAVTFLRAYRRHVPKAALALAVLSPPFLHGLATGQVSALIAAGILWACATSNRIAGGLVFGLIATIKPQLVIMAPLMLALNADKRAVLSAAAGFSVIVTLSIAAFGFERWPEWLASMDHFEQAVTGTDVIRGAISPAVVAERYGFEPLPFLIVGTALGAATVYLCRDAAPLEKATAIGIGSIMAAPYSLGYDLAVALPFLACAILRGRILAVLVFVYGINPLPILVSAYELIRSRLSHRSQARAEI